MPLRLAVLASGGGTNLQALIDRFHPDPAAPARVELVVASRTGIGALERAAAAGIPALVRGPEALGAERFGESILASLDAYEVDLVILAGWLQLLPPGVVARWAGRILNIHPALLPAFGGSGMYGLRVHRAVLDSGARVSGASVHLVDERYDEGRIIAQWPVPVLPDDTPETLAARVLRVEHLLLPAAVEAFATGEPIDPFADPIIFDLVEGLSPPTNSVRRLLASPPADD
jgi:formyltetrahydrofolate-dependent phosphoribosylglycinamide formyltransferase